MTPRSPRHQEISDLKEVQGLIEKALPSSHPAISKLENAIVVIEGYEAAPGSQLLEALIVEPAKMEELMYTVGDWMRGAKDWAEVEVLFRHIESHAGAQGEYLPAR
jgi:hypothetical protein